ncbi:bifunctional ADP-dependent NAD(P)H-hydrate dehydratase/NAD(P)H-hydrate epimerase [Cellulosimicrobium marinum]|uniref:bifunctional ADP-dependent NAD(P)H-hydrate dehydratase/NAD(P)H-hydrate epimerase n=1 Tax=Cellulosimicrobium marinum TaxID=1638992 RepID=UPI001E6055A2|nr:bifunctional ADP-dependent NAD(P)H-hydrate dehydratase/NAD(P)H-hydrate epimerase [Cellulosimicrobium marinum]MCB7136733.1 bifunctional ADP-dependent (S)-NAD(P)H-hydrate dehydratase/NAD(P)H-hydrate epimerase [Cellulosimicrobium marinum]
MIEAWTAADVRAAERPLLDAGVPLMERAAFALATVVARDLARARSVVGPDGGRRDGRVTGTRVVLLVGAGNNGGDALHAGAYLARRGVRVTAVLTSDRTHEGGLVALRRAGGSTLDLDLDLGDDALARAVREVRAADAVLDGLVGIGATGPLRGTPGVLVRRIVDDLDGAPRRPWVVAVDAPSGVGVDDGTVPGPVLRADRTVTFGAAKPGLLVPPATHLAGRGAVVDLGLDLRAGPAVRRLERHDVAALWAVPGPDDHKYTRGVVGVVAGTSTYPGAAVLVSSAAVRTGPGMVRYLGPDDVTQAVLAAHPEVVAGAGRVQAWTLGSGVPAAGGDPVDDGGQHDRVRAALAPADVPAVVDAGALSLLPGRCPASVVLTPHAGELATLLGARGEDVTRADVEAEPLRWARRAHDLTGATVLLKGSVTLVVGPGVVYAQADAPPWLATAGAGDVLAGILGTLLAAHAERVRAEPALAAELGAAAALVHGLAAERANPGGPVAARDVADQVPRVVADLLATR